MRRPRALSAEEAALWQRVATTVKPLRMRVVPAPTGEGDHEVVQEHKQVAPPQRRQAVPCVSLHRPAAAASPSRKEEQRPLDSHGLDAGWDRRLGRGLVQPDFTLDLHGHGLDSAYRRLDHGLALARAQQARVVLVITGRPRPVDAADRGARRGAIRAKLLDWLAAGSHASRIAAVRAAHQRHGGAGAVYVVLKRG